MASGQSGLLVCNSSDVWELAQSWYATSSYGYIVPNIGNDTGSCTTAKTGELIYNGSAFEYCSGTSWTSFGGASLNNVNVELAAGSAAAPSLSFYSDTNTGMYQASSGSNTINFASAGAEIAAFDSTGDFNLTNAGATSAGAYEINGTVVVALPDKDTTSIGVGKFALSSQNATSEDNVAVGYDALNSNTSGSGNTALGMDALASISTGSGSTAVGTSALYEATGSPNEAMGYTAGKWVTSGSDNIAIGYDAMVGNSTNPLTATTAGNIAIGDNALTAITGAAAGNVAIGFDALTSSSINSTAPNTAIGFEAMQFATTGTNNTAIGNLAMQGTSANPLTGAGENVALGDSALNAIESTAVGNTAVGYAAMSNGFVTGSDNSAFGNSALYDNSSGGNNAAIGFNALLFNTSGGDNIAIGSNALYHNTTGNGSTAVGYGALYNATASNMAIGFESGYYITSGTGNIAIGDGVMVGTTGNPVTGNYNVAIGDSALIAITGAASDNTVLGYEAGTAVTSGTDNTLIGYQAGYGVTGSHNIILGEDPSSAITTGSSNILIGNSLTGLTAANNYQLNIGNVVTGTGLGTPSSSMVTAAGSLTVTTGLIASLIYPPSDSTTAIQIDKANGATNVLEIDTTNGRVGIGTAPSFPLDVQSSGIASSTEYDVGRFAQLLLGTGVVAGYYTNPAGTAVQEARVRSSGSVPLALGTTSFPQAIYVLNTGAVGIGNTGPSATLDVSGTIYSRRVALTDGSTIAVNWASGNIQSVTLGGNRTFTFSNAVDGARYILILKQDTTGSRTATWPATVRWPGATAPVLTTTASKTDYITFIYNGVDSKYDGVAITQNF